MLIDFNQNPTFNPESRKEKVIGISTFLHLRLLAYPTWQTLETPPTLTVFLGSLETGKHNSSLLSGKVLL
jgi:hypothetical protein